MKGFRLDKEVPVAEVNRLIDSAKSLGLELTDEQAYKVWVSYSLSLSYGWLDLPESDAALAVEFTKAMQAPSLF